MSRFYGYVVGVHKGFHYERRRLNEVFPCFDSRTWRWFAYNDRERTDIFVCGVETKAEMIELLDEEDARLRLDHRAIDPRRRERKVA